MNRSRESSSVRCGAISRWLVVSLIVTSLAIPVVSFAVGEKFPDVPDAGFTIVSRGPMELIVTQSGEIDSADNDILISKCEWSTRILSIVPEGTWVEEGDIVAELDSSEIRKRHQERAVLLVNAKARLADAQEDLQIQKLTNESLLADSALQLRLAELQLDGYLKAEYPQKLHELEAAVALAEEELTRAKKKHDFVTGMVRLGYRTPTDRESERINVLKKEQALELANDKLTVLRDFTHQRTLTQYTAIAEETRRELDRVKLAAKAAILRREILVRSRERSHQIYDDYQKRLEKNIAACTIRASKAGEIIYARERSSSSSRIDEGSSVRYLQALATIPDRDRLQVKLRLHESNIRLIDKDQPALIQVDANPDHVYQGHISHISTVPMSGRYPNYHLREYRVTVDLDADPEMSRTIAPGMTASVNIVAAQRQATLQVPVQAVVEVGDEYLAFVRNNGEIEHRIVKVGISSDDKLEITEGLDEGEEVVLKPRVTCAQRIVALQRTLQKGDENSYWLSLVR